MLSRSAMVLLGLLEITSALSITGQLPGGLIELTCRPFLVRTQCSAMSDGNALEVCWSCELKRIVSALRSLSTFLVSGIVKASSLPQRDCELYPKL